ncbi:hypothetical protein Tco_0853076 [Tanacetum coccineum]
MRTEMELTLEQTQQSVSYEVSVDPYGFKGSCKDGDGEDTFILAKPFSEYDEVVSTHASQTRSNVPILEEITIAALRDSLMESMMEEMDGLRAELRNNVVDPNDGTVVRQNYEGQSPMQYSRLTKVEFPKFWWRRCKGMDV